MGGKSFRLAVLTLAVLLLAAGTEGAEPPPSCEAVRKVFQLRRLDPLGGVPESPRAGKAELAGQEALAAAEPLGLNLVPPAAMRGWWWWRGLASRAHRVPSHGSDFEDVGTGAPGHLPNPPRAHPLPLRIAQSRASRLQLGSPCFQPAVGRHRYSGVSANPVGWDSQRPASRAAEFLCCEMGTIYTHVSGRAARFPYRISA